MLKVNAMAPEEMQALLRRVGFGHLACTGDGLPYIVPMHYAYDSQDIYFFTSEGLKTEYMSVNPIVCFQVEEITDPSHWQSVMVTGRAERLTEPDKMERAMQLITVSNPTLTPAINRTQIGGWEHGDTIAIYRLRPSTIDGRKTV